jgi:hypothetical protein
MEYMAGSHHITRRRLIGRTGGGLALAVLSKPLIVSAAKAADALEESKVEIAAVRDPQLGAQIAIANEFGYFKDEGLDATVHWNQSGADVITVMAGGSQYIGTGGVFAEVVFGGQDLRSRSSPRLPISPRRRVSCCRLGSSCPTRASWKARNWPSPRATRRC